jgi:lipopolysaccharide export system protein LptA
MHLLRILFAATLLTISAAARAQEQPQATEPTRISVDYSDLFEYVQKDGQTVQKLLGSVELHQDSIFMYCDSAFIFNETDVIAMGRVLIQQGDSLSVFADSLAYQGATRIADLFGEVVLANKDQKLFTDRLNYDLGSKIATYDTGALLTNDTSQLISKRGYYYVDQDEIFFKDSVQIIDPNFELRTDTLSFNTQTQIAKFLAPTLIVQDSSRIYCESGYYDLRNQQALFSDKPQYQKGESKATAEVMRYDGRKQEIALQGNARFEEPGRKASADILTYLESTEEIFLIGHARYESDEQVITADTISYDQRNETYITRGRSLISDPPQLIEADRIDYEKESGLGVALGDVIWQDTSAGLSILCAEARYREENDYLQAFGGRAGRPLLIARVDEDSMYMTADTLLTRQQDTLAGDTSRLLLAYNQVRIFKSNLQALCDSVSYSSGDSLFRLYRDPLIWSDTSQFSADTIHIQLAEGKLSRIDLYDKSLIVNSPDLVYFNQIKGRNIHAFIEENEIRRMRVEGNAESLYYVLDEEDAYLGVNKTVCSEMLFLFAEKKLKAIKFYQEPSGKLTPMDQADHESLKLPGFRWEYDRRPRSVDDLFPERQ